jgi:transcriptional regulator with XRE-family HTH domain
MGQMKSLPTGQVLGSCRWGKLMDMNRIRAVREARGFTLDDVAPKIGITVPHLSRMERGKRPLTDDWMRRIAGVLNCDPREFLSDPEGRPLPGEIIKEGGEVNLVRWWRGLDDAERRLVIRMMHPPSPTRRDDAA